MLEEGRMLEFSMYEALRMSVVQQFRGAGRMDPVGLVGTSSAF